MIILWPMTTILTFNKNFLAIKGNANRECFKSAPCLCESTNLGACSVRIHPHNKMQAAERYGEYYG